jgi:malonyl-CoA/methylmalonyl-CoA synthetase
VPVTRNSTWRVHLPSGVDPDRLDLLAAGSLPAAWRRLAEADPDRPALWAAGRGWVSRGELEQAGARVAGRLRRAGLAAGDRVLVSAATSMDLVVAYLGALRMGLVVVPVNTAYREREVAHIVGDAAPRAAVVDDPERGRWAQKAAGGDLLVVGPEADLPGGDPPALDGGGPGDPALLCYTSGTTGAPKGAVLSHGNLLASAEALRLAWRWTGEDRLVLALFHIHGLGVGLHGTLLVGASAVLLPRFEVDAVLDAARDHRATLFFGVPTMYTRLADSPRAGELGRLRLCVSGSAPLPPTVFERLADRAGQRVLERYGMTETIMNVSNPYDGERRPGTVGLPLPGVELRLAGGQEGEVLLRGPNVFGGYWRNPEATAEAFDPDGWFRTGDLGSFDERGYLRIEGRSKELIITGGYNVHPREVEELLLEHPGVAEAAVVGTPSEEWGEQVTAFVVPADPAAPPDREELLGFAAERLAGFKRPRVVHYVDALPRNALGKVLKHELRGRG